MAAQPSLLAPGPGAFRLLLAAVVLYDHFFGLLIGRAAVYLFFVLSGFWIHRMWIERYVLAEKPWLTFMASRLWRLAPVMLLSTVLALAVSLLVLRHDLDAVFHDTPFHTLFSHVFFLGYSKLSSPRLVEPAWSLDAEMQFYIVAPLLVGVLARLGAWKFIALSVVLVAIGWLAPHAEPLRMLAWFAVGMTVSSRSWQPSVRLAQLSLAAGIALLLVFAVSDLHPILTDRSFYTANTVLNWSLAIVLIPFAVRTCFGKGGERDRLYGDLSYIVYLAHWPLVVWMRESALADGVVGPLLVFPATILLSLLICHRFDRPIQHWRTRWVAKRIDRGKARRESSAIAIGARAPGR